MRSCIPDPQPARLRHFPPRGLCEAVNLWLFCFLWKQIPVACPSPSHGPTIPLKLYSWMKNMKASGKFEKKKNPVHLEIFLFFCPEPIRTTASVKQQRRKTGPLSSILIAARINLCPFALAIRRPRLVVRPGFFFFPVYIRARNMKKGSTNTHMWIRACARGHLASSQTSDARTKEPL